MGNYQNTFIRSGLDPAVMQRDHGHTPLTPHNAEWRVSFEMKCVPSWYRREGEFMNTDESRLVNRTDGIMWKFSLE